MKVATGLQVRWCSWNTEVYSVKTDGPYFWDAQNKERTYNIFGDRPFLKTSTQNKKKQMGVLLVACVSRR